jgi:ribonuclease HIII
MKEVKAKIENPLSGLISDDIYELLSSQGLIDSKSVRDYQIRRQFKQLRSNKVSAGEAIDAIQHEYKYLQFDTIRKIVYQINSPAPKENNNS